MSANQQRLKECRVKILRHINAVTNQLTDAELFDLLKQLHLSIEVSILRIEKTLGARNEYKNTEGNRGIGKSHDG